MKQDQAGPPLTTRSAGQRRFWSSEEKRRMVAESFAPGASVSKVAERYGVNANPSFTWRRPGEHGGLREPRLIDTDSGELA